MQKSWAILVSFYYFCKFYKIGMWQKGQYSLLRVDRLKTQCSLLCWTHYQSMQDNNSKPHLILNQPRNNILFSPVLTAPSFWLTGCLSKQTSWFPDLQSCSYSQWIFCKLYSHITVPAADSRQHCLKSFSRVCHKYLCEQNGGPSPPHEEFAGGWRHLQFKSTPQDTRVVDCLQDSISLNTKHLLPRRKWNIS